MNIFFFLDFMWKAQVNCSSLGQQRLKNKGCSNPCSPIHIHQHAEAKSQNYTKTEAALNDQPWQEELVPCFCWARNSDFKLLRAETRKKSGTERKPALGWNKQMFQLVCLLSWITFHASYSCNQNEGREPSIQMPSSFATAAWIGLK